MKLFYIILLISLLASCSQRDMILRECFKDGKLVSRETAETFSTNGRYSKCGISCLLDRILYGDYAYADKCVLTKLRDNYVVTLKGRKS